MTPEQAKQLLPVFSALAEGKSIQFLQSTGNWKDTPNPNFDYYNTPDRYRIKPEKKTGWVAIYPCHQSNAFAACGYIYATKEACIKAEANYSKTIAIIQIEYEQGEGL